ncbi:type II secretion system F family protein [Streptomyces stelliscabiei]|uniref:type II secretion system F family protein n=1 Tax=Streptomyces stelliscabiei TaxID=146820 RepID=UPI0029A2AF90|nr:type II secretion system F family protein [Streptomyces stelliscabiei]MDX2552788.1 type II secretion system F family protein [Streptomyces stelliscabiei]MDX2613891.1 type II secretion system F family protein [Streptomyces stelliscabiei]MDX2637990.1 type II secretion system F family protein [Streptomyces stelliscabiei]MDX2661423.1 type II secretion system F family protein [Streptomyces stelliscabiei]MDX2713132.1 type II secretion system F family protein [Streptomyces stelliscabiei]
MVTGVGEMSVGVVAVACAGAAGWMSGEEGGAGVRRARLLLAGGGPVGPPPWARAIGRVRRLGAEWWAPVAGLAIAVLGASVLPVLAGAAAVPLLRRVRRVAEESRARQRRGDAVVALCSAVAGEVRAGRQPGEALARAARDSAGLGDAEAVVLAAARFGGDVPGALADAARQPGADGLLGLAACWRVAVDRGAGLAAGLDRLEGALRAERDQRADLRAQLAGARSTAVMLAGLPVLGLLLGTALGADPLRVVLHSTAGLGCLLVGGALEGAGLWWALRIVRGAEAA